MLLHLFLSCILLRCALRAVSSTPPPSSKPKLYTHIITIIISWTLSGEFPVEKTTNKRIPSLLVLYERAYVVYCRCGWQMTAATRSSNPYKRTFFIGLLIILLINRFVRCSLVCARLCYNKKKP